MAQRGRAEVTFLKINQGTPGMGDGTATVIVLPSLIRAKLGSRFGELLLSWNASGAGRNAPESR